MTSETVRPSNEELERAQEVLRRAEDAKKVQSAPAKPMDNVKIFVVRSQFEAEPNPFQVSGHKAMVEGGILTIYHNAQPVAQFASGMWTNWVIAPEAK